MAVISRFSLSPRAGRLSLVLGWVVLFVILSKCWTSSIPFPTGNTQPSGPIGTQRVNSKIAKVTANMGFQQPDPNFPQPEGLGNTYEAVLQLHKGHNDQNGYSHFVLRQDTSLAMFSKPAYILSVMLQELSKPPAERLEWLFWHDGDTLLMNSNLPLEVFVPPEDFGHVNLVISNDHRGLNNGVFFLRVTKWSVAFLNSWLAYKYFYPEAKLGTGDQAPMQVLLLEEQWANSTVHVPQHWFNAYRKIWNLHTPPEWNWSNRPFEPGHLLIHFAGSRFTKMELLEKGMKDIKNSPATYNVPLAETGLSSEITDFWRNDAHREKERQSTYRRRLGIGWKTKKDIDRLTEEETKKVIADMAGKEKASIDAAVDAVRSRHANSMVEKMREEERLILLDTEKREN